MADADLTSIGLPRARADTLRALSRAVAGGSLRLDSSQGLGDAISRLCTVPGIGEWTAQYVAMRAFGEPDAFPASDLGLRRALATNGALPSEAEVQREAEEWRPWRAYAAMYLWTAGTGRERQEDRMKIEYGQVESPVGTIEVAASDGRLSRSGSGTATARFGCWRTASQHRARRAP
jgi:3-methyladenine DNA glycosylase/8-oxoguanine DNA glycosylase